MHALSHDTDELIGATVGEYQVLGRLGVGGMGVVYEGRHPVIGKRVAIKVLMPQLSAQTELVQRFLAEARAVNAIRHRGIVDIFSFGSLPSGALYFVMEYLEGESLEKVIDRGALPVGDALAIVEEVLDALAAAHEAQVIHRDIKPSNLFLVSSARGKAYVKLLDFGIAKLTAREGEGSPQTRASVIMGTPDYIAPEQAKGAPITPQTDLYAVGVVLFELLTGFRPFRGDNPIQTMWMHLEQPAPKPSSVVPELPALLDSVCLWAMQKNPADRPRSADHLREVIASLRASFARNALGSPLTPAGSPRPLSAIDGLPPELALASAVPPTLYGLATTGAQATVQSLEPVPERPVASGAGPKVTLDEAALNPSSVILAEPKTEGAAPAAPAPVPKRAAPADSTRIERPPEAPSQPLRADGTRIERVESAPSTVERERLSGPSSKVVVAPSTTGPELTPLGTDLEQLTHSEQNVVRRVPVLAIALVAIAVIGLVGGTWVLLRPSGDDVVSPVVVPVTAPEATADRDVGAEPMAAAPKPELPAPAAARLPEVEPPRPPEVTKPTAVHKPEEVRRPTAPAKPAGPSQAALQLRLTTLERQLDAKEKARGEPDRTLRKYFARVRDNLSQAATDVERREVQKELEELSGLLR